VAGAGDTTTSTPTPTPTATAGRRIRGLDADQRRDQRRRQLLDATLELVATKGYNHTSIEQICQTAYVATRGFYQLFDGKEACYLALLQRIADDIGDRMVTALAEAPDDAAVALRGLLAAFAHALVDDPRVARASFGEGAGISTAVERQRRANRRWAADFLVDVWRRYGLAPEGHDPRPVAVGVIGGLFDLVVDWLHEADMADPADPAEPGPAAAGDVESLVRDLTEFYELVQAGMASRSA
jgi:AcrR family transcriptional regulator